MTNAAIGGHLRRESAKRGDPYRARAYQRAADTIEALAEPVVALFEKGKLTDIPGVSQGIAAIIARLLDPED